MATQKYAVDVDGDGKDDYYMTLEKITSNVTSNVTSNATSNTNSNVTANIMTGPTTNLSSNAFSNANILDGNYDWFKDILYSKTFDDVDPECYTVTTNDSSLQGYPTYDEVLVLLDKLRSSINSTDAKITTGVKNAQNLLDNNLG